MERWALIHLKNFVTLVKWTNPEQDIHITLRSAISVIGFSLKLYIPLSICLLC